MRIENIDTYGEKSNNSVILETMNDPKDRDVAIKVVDRF